MKAKENYKEDHMDYNALAQRLLPGEYPALESFEKRYPPRDLPKNAEVTRLAPSPTGFIHLGNLFVAIANERIAHRSGGTLYLRIEDTDLKRKVDGAVEAVISALDYFDIRFDEGAEIGGDDTYAPWYQRQRADIYRAYEMAQKFGFDVNFDLIAGLTGETCEEFEESVDRAIALSPENITVHTLCLKKGAKLKEEVSTLGEGALSEMIAYSREKLTAAGYEPYYLYRQKYMAGAHENVGWTKAGYASVYNVDIMEEIADNLAVGANAVSKKVFLSAGRIERCGSPKDIPTYLAKAERVIAEKRELWR